MPVRHSRSAPVKICIRERAKHRFYISLYQLDFTRSPGLVEIQLERAIEAQAHPPTLARHSVHPVALLANWRFRAEIDIDRLRVGFPEATEQKIPYPIQFTGQLCAHLLSSRPWKLVRLSDTASGVNSNAKHACAWPQPGVRRPHPRAGGRSPYAASAASGGVGGASPARPHRAGATRGAAVQGRGFSLDAPPWQAAVFSMTRGA